MQAIAEGISEQSELFFYSPSQAAKKLYYYPICAGHFFYDKSYHLARQTYNSLLILQVMDGTFTYVKNGEAVTARAGETVILDCYKEHEYYTADGCEAIWAHICGGNATALYEEIAANRGNRIRSEDAQHIEHILFRIFERLGRGEPPAELALSLDVYSLLTALLSPQRAVRQKNGSDAEDMQRVKQYIASHLEENLSVKSLAEKAHMSPSRFSRVFKQQTGFSPYDYVLTSRLSRAKELLRKTDMSITAIAYEIGFNSESNFIYFFNENEGISPGKFRKLKF